MLGWFKKKFTKKTEETPAEQQAFLEPATAPEEALEHKTVGAPDPVSAALPEIQAVPIAAAPEKQAPMLDAVTGAEPPERRTEKAGEASVSLLKRLADKLAKTREAFTDQIDSLFLGKKQIDAELLDDLEEILITADLGVATTRELLDNARRRVNRKELADPQALKDAIKEQIKSFIADYQEDAELVMPDSGPFVIMVIGVNGVGKTTTIGKIAHKFIKAGRSVMLVAGDTFRAAAVSQLQIWGERNKALVVARADGADPSSVVYDAMDIALAKDYDVVLVDTAGRLHTQTNLMEELKKIKRVMAKRLTGAPHEVMLVVDATTGQNGISQAKLFHEAIGITGITLTKLDGTAKGGIVANICRELKTPIRFIGVGEKMEDLRDFNADEFIEALFHGRSPETEPPM